MAGRYVVDWLVSDGASDGAIDGAIVDAIDIVLMDCVSILGVLVFAPG